MLQATQKVINRVWELKELVDEETFKYLLVAEIVKEFIGAKSEHEVVRRVRRGRSANKPSLEELASSISKSEEEQE